jgi:hypothetical protein
MAALPYARFAAGAAAEVAATAWIALRTRT